MLQQEMAMQEKDINCELRKLLALNFPGFFHVLLGQNNQVDISEHSEESTTSDDEENKQP
jgi:hypothetical protein